MRLESEKCEYFRLSVDYLGHTISSEDLRTSDAKVQAILQAPTPKNVAEHRSFLGLVNYYYGKFLPNLATILSPLYRLLQKKQEWTWNSDQEAFRKVKELFKSS